MEGAMNNPNPRGALEQGRKGYSEEEIECIYRLAYAGLENGNLKQAELIALGLIEVAPSFIPGWLALAYVRGQDGNFAGAQAASEQALRIDGESIEAMLFLVSYLLTNGDLQSAGTYLGEVADRIDNNQLTDPTLIRFFRAQMLRYQTREV
jgi:Tfp pilus assembly protein PilF